MVETEAVPLEVVSTTTPETGATRDIYTSGRSGRLAYQKRVKSRKNARTSGQARKQDINKLQKDINKQKQRYEAEIKKYKQKKSRYEKEYKEYESEFKKAKKKEDELKKELDKEDKSKENNKVEVSPSDLEGVSTEDLMKGEGAFKQYSPEQQATINQYEQEHQVSLSPELKSRLVDRYKPSYQIEKAPTVNLEGISKKDLLEGNITKSTKTISLDKMPVTGRFEPGVKEKAEPITGRYSWHLGDRSYWEEKYNITLRKGDVLTRKAQQTPSVIKGAGYALGAMGMYTYNLLPTAVRLGQEVYDVGVDVTAKPFKVTPKIYSAIGHKPSKKEKELSQKAVKTIESLKTHSDKIKRPPLKRTYMERLRSGTTQAVALAFLPYVGQSLADDFTKTMTKDAGKVIQKPKYISNMRYLEKKGNKYLLQNIKTAKPKVIQSSYLESNPEGFVTFKGKAVPYKTISVSTRDVSTIIKTKPELLQIKGPTQKLLTSGKGPVSTELFGKDYMIASRGKTTLYNTYGQRFTYNYDTTKRITNIKDVKLNKDLTVSMMRDITGKRYNVFSTKTPTYKELLKGKTIKSAFHTDRYLYLQDKDYQAIGFLKTPTTSGMKFSPGTGKGLYKIPKDTSTVRRLYAPALNEPSQIKLNKLGQFIDKSKTGYRTFKGLDIRKGIFPKKPSSIFTETTFNLGQGLKQTKFTEAEAPKTIQVRKTKTKTARQPKLKFENAEEQKTIQEQLQKQTQEQKIKEFQKQIQEQLQKQTPKQKSKIIQKLKQKNKLKYYNIQKQKQMNRQKTIQEQLQEQLQKQKQKQMNRQKTIQEQLQEQLQKQMNRQKTIQEQLLKQDFMQKQGQMLETQNILEKQPIHRQITENQPYNITPRTTPFGPSFTPIKPPLFTPKGDSTPPKGRVEVKTDIPYNTYVREKGKWNKIDIDNKTRNKYAAMALGRKVTDQTSARSWKVTKGRGTSVDIKRKTKPKLGKFYRMSKTQDPKLAGAWIEKSKHAIDSPGEMKGITSKGWEKQRKQKFVKNYLGGKSKTKNKIKRKTKRRPRKRTGRSVKIKPPKLKSVI